jgi:hypothetical protein
MEKFENKVLFIKDEEMLKEVREIIDNNKKTRVSDNQFRLCEPNFNYLYFEKYFAIGIKKEWEEEIDFEIFKQILK